MLVWGLLRRQLEACCLVQVISQRYFLGVGLFLRTRHKYHEVSGAEGSHLRALAEPYVTLSRHTAPIVRPRPKSKAQ